MNFGGGTGINTMNIMSTLSTLSTFLYKNSGMSFGIIKKNANFVGKFRMMKKILTVSIMAIAITSMAVTEPKATKDVTNRDTLKVDTITKDSIMYIEFVNSYSSAPQM